MKMKIKYFNQISFPQIYLINIYRSNVNILQIKVIKNSLSELCKLNILIIFYASKNLFIKSLYNY